MTVGNLDYKIESDDLSNNSITLGANESKEIELTIRSLNKIDSKYKLYTNSVENVTIGYLDEEGFDESTGTISATGTVKVKIVLDNESDTSKTITFGVQGGFDYNDVTLKSGRVEVEEGEALCPAGIAYEFDYTGSVQKFTAKCPGVYKLEVWGAQGGGDNNDIGGLGAYTKGDIELVKNTNLYIQVGQAGTYDWTNCNDSTYNGGSSGGCMTSFVGGSGGGSTDIRLSSGNWNDFDSLKSRIMVAAGGAGAIYYNDSYHYSGKPGGGLTGTSGVVINLGGPTSHGEAPYAKQTKYDSQYYFSGANRYNTLTSAENGKFGIAGKIYYNNELKDTGSSLYGALLSGGSGGYYGGASGVDTSSYGGTGSSGSSFISGYNGCDAIAESSTENNIVHTNQPNHYSGNVFNNAVMIDGAGCNWSTGSATNCGANQPQPDGTMATGHSGNGYARITYLGERIVLFNAGSGTVLESSRKVKYGSEIGELPTPTNGDRIFAGWYSDSELTTNVDSNYIVTDSVTLYAKWISFDSLSFIDDVQWTVYHSGNGMQSRAYNSDNNSYNFFVGGLNTIGTYYTHRFTTDVIQLPEPVVLNFSHQLYTGSGYNPSGQIIIYDASDNVLYNSTVIGSSSSSVNVPAGGFKIYLNYYGPGNWYGTFTITSIEEK